MSKRKKRKPIEVELKSTIIPISTELLHEFNDELFVCEHCDAAQGTWFDRSVCPEPCGSMHTRCTACGMALDECTFDTEEFTGLYQSDYAEGVAEGTRIENSVARMMTPPRRVHMPPDVRNKSDGYRAGVESVLGNVKWPDQG